MQSEPPPRPPRLPTQGQATYRLYFLDGAGHIGGSHEFFADDDDAAIRVAESWQEGRKMELWERTRMVKRWE